MRPKCSSTGVFCWNPIHPPKVLLHLCLCWTPKTRKCSSTGVSVEAIFRGNKEPRKIKGCPVPRISQGGVDRLFLTVPQLPVVVDVVHLLHKATLARPRLEEDRRRVHDPRASVGQAMQFDVVAKGSHVRWRSKRDEAFIPHAAEGLALRLPRSPKRLVESLRHMLEVGLRLLHIRPHLIVEPYAIVATIDSLAALAHAELCPAVALA